jgi:hypothetical protein
MSNLICAWLQHMNAHLRFALTILLVLAAPRPQAIQRITMVVSPSKAMAPATLRVRLGVEPTTENRALDVVVDSGDFFRSSEIALDGERAPRTIIMEFPGLPGGTYVVRGMIRDVSGHPRASVDQEVTVIRSVRE